MNYSDKQLKIFETYKNTNSNIAISAAPGSGKTTTLVEILRRTSPHKRCIFLAFNKSIQMELERRVPENTDALTLHSLGYRTLLRNAHNKYKLSELKNWILGKQVLDLSHIRDEKQKNIYLFTISRLVDLYRMNVLSSEEDLAVVADKYNISVLNGELKDSMSLIRYLDGYNRMHRDNQMLIDYVDMLWLPYILLDESRFKKYNVVLIDESQDLNKLQFELVKRIMNRRSRFVSVGDPHQCQPEGTKITMRDGSLKNIEQLVIGDEVVSYEARNRGYFVGFKKNYDKNGRKTNKVKSPAFVKSIQKIPFDGNLIELTSKNKTTKYTFNHKCVVRWRKDKTQAHAIYLMQKDNVFRIGITPLWTKNQLGSVTTRAKAENADKMWILDIFTSREEAHLNEQFCSVYFGIPQMIFTLRGQRKSTITQFTIDKFYAMFDDNLQPNAINLLTHFNKSVDLPFWTKGGKNYNSKIHIFETYACNIFKDYMEVGHFNKDNETLRHSYMVRKMEFAPIKTLNILPYKGFVYALDINKFHMYVGDGILTHNSIYSFQGADSDVFQQIIKQKGTVNLPLSYTYRCGKRIVEEANKVFDFIETPAGQHEGEVFVGSIDKAMAGDMVICRNNAPLIDAFLYLLKKRKKSIIMGKDYEKGLLNVLSKMEDFSEESKQTILKNKSDELRKRGIRNPENNQSYQSLVEKIYILDQLHREFSSLDILKSMIEGMFSDKTSDDAIILSTIHKAKGSEADNVFFLMPDLIPSKYAETMTEQYAEQCLMYVAITRAKNKLIYVKSI